KIGNKIKKLIAPMPIKPQWVFWFRPFHKKHKDAQDAFFRFGTQGRSYARSGVIRGTSGRRNITPCNTYRFKSSLTNDIALYISKNLTWILYYCFLNVPPMNHFTSSFFIQGYKEAHLC